MTFRLVNMRVSKPHVENIILLSNAAATGNGESIDLTVPLSQFTCTVEWAGTVPTSVTVILQGSIDGLLWADLATVTITASGSMFHIINKAVRYIRGNYTSRVGGDSSTAVTMKCQAGGN